jgi:hypothetical protein
VDWWGPTVAVVVVLLLFWRDSSSRLRSQRVTVATPEGARFDVLVHRHGVPLYTHVPQWSGLSIGMFATLWAVARRRTKNRWAVTVRQSPYPGHSDLLHEVCATEEAAHQRAKQVVESVRSGHRLWDQAQER